MAVRVQKSAVNIREKLAELERPIGVNGQALMATDTPQQAFSLIGAGRRNVIINGNFRISQRGTYTSATSVSTGNYYLDRWKTDFSGVTATIQQQTNQTITSDIIANTAKLAATSTATGYLQLRQYVELDANLYGKTVTVSAWVRSNRFARLRIESALFGGSNYDSLVSHSGNGGWEYLTMTVNLQTSPSNIIFGVILWGGTGGTTGATTTINSGDYIEFTNFQVEIGKVATPFEHRSYGEELTLCQRYFYRFRCANQEWIYNEGNVANGKWHQFYIGHAMRTNPSIDVGNLATGVGVVGLSGTISSIAPQSPGDTPGRVSSRIVMSSAGGTAYNLHHHDNWVSNYISISAEF